MSVLRLIFLWIAVWLVWRMLRRWLHGEKTSYTRTSPVSPSLHMVRCAHCGIHLPQRDALQKGDHWYCGRPHLEANRVHQRAD